VNEIAKTKSNGRLNRTIDGLGIWLILLLAAATRLINLGFPHKLVFDETYYVKDAWTLGNLGYEGSWPQDPNSAFEAGRVDIFSTSASYVVHPPLGKWLIFLGMKLFGPDNSVGWRFSVAVLGIASVWLIYIIAARLFGSKRWALVPAFLLTIDGHAIVMSRTALLDGILAFFVLLAFYFLLRDRALSPLSIWRRPWLVAMALTLGLASAVKWSGLYFLAVFTLYVLVSDLLLQRKISQAIGRERFDWIGSLVKHGFVKALLTLPVAALAYVVTWTGWFVTSAGYYRQVQPDQSGFPDWLSWIPQPIQAFWYYQVQIYSFHVNMTTPHGYAVSPLTWLLPIRPTAFFYEGADAGTGNCDAAENCVNAITALGNPAIWLMALVALIAICLRWVRLRNKVSSLVLLGIVAGYLPWLMYLQRTTFQFYAIVFLPWMLLALTYWLKLRVESAEPERAARSKAWVVSFLAFALVVSIFFSNIWLGYTTSYWYWHIHMWLPSWI
jgi:dolichyl-phosphate-mannose--protein O-mannosyl transferase